jgi:hypothetical protein
MPEIRARFDAVLDDYSAAADNLTNLLAYIVQAGPGEPALRVTLLNNTLVALVATTEEGLRNVFSEYLLIVNEQLPDHRALRKGLQKANINALLSQLKKLNEPSTTAQAASAAQNLTFCLDGNPLYRLQIEDLTYNVGNFRTNEITEVAKKAGVGDIIARVCDDPNVGDWTGREDIAGRVTALSAQWNEIFAERDLIVHKLSSANGWGAEKIERAIRLGKLLLTRVTRVVEADLRSLIAH